MLPDCIEATDFRYIKIDNKFLISLTIKSLPDKIYFLDVLECIDKNIEYDMSISYKKLDPIKVLNDITYNIANIQSELETISKNQRNIDVVNKANQDAQNLRKKIQLENQELYSINIILSFYSENLIQLQKIISSLRAKFYSKRIKSDTTNFIHLQFFLYSLPLNLKNNMQNQIYITTDALANIFPFYTNNLIDTNGIVFGYTELNNSLCVIDMFSNKYENSNMCIFGASGSGKSFFTKLLICRNFFYGKRQIILDEEGEYHFLCQKLGGKIIDENTYYNILQITNKDLQEERFLDSKIDRIIHYIMELCDTSNIEIKKLKNELEKLYSKFNIFNNRKSVLLYQEEDIVHLDSKILSNEKFPTLQDLKDNVSDQNLKVFLEENINGVLNFFSKTTTFDLNEYIYVISVNKIQFKNRVLGIILEGILNRYLGEKETLIYIDEVWKYADNHKTFNCILNMYKTIRKRRAAIITITQDITDLFRYESGLYAKGILNNSCFKMIFKTEYKDENIFNQLINFSCNELSNLKKGEALLLINKNRINIKIKANKFEGEIINENDNSN